jgi:uncharacterized protein YlxW (UPF0749 family)
MTTDPRPEDAAATPGPTVTPGPAVPARAATARRSSFLIGLLALLLGFGLVIQVKSTESNSALPSARQEDLVRILDDLNSREERLRREINELNKTRTELSSDTAGTSAALEESRRMARELGILAGTVPVSGPGVVITITEKNKTLPADVVLDAMEELRGAGAEAVQISGASGGSVRVGTSTYFLDADGGILVDGTTLRGPYEIIVVGDPATLAGALNIPGGVVSTVDRASATARIQQRGRVVITALRRVGTPQYAQPVR